MSVHDPVLMTGIVLIGAAFASREIASIAFDRLRRYQARRAGRLRMARLGAVGRVADDIVVAGPVLEDHLEAVYRTVEDLGGRVAAVVRARHP
jgi:histidinol-phosphate/aromatic aminotransferase/cobyric acid decarboxylase-like protein